MRVTKSSNNLAGWMDNFLVGLSKKFASGENQEPMEKEDVVDDKDQITTVAEINISDLPKITWNDETFYIKLGEKGADVLNEFGNTVTNLPNVHSVEEVDKKLNGDQVVIAASEEPESDFSEELNKVVAAIEDEVKQPVEGKEELEVTSSEDPTEVELTPETESEEADDNGDLLTEAIASGFGELETRLAFAEEQLKTLSQEYARVKELINVDNGSGGEEQKHFEEQARNTQQSIDNSKNHDITTPQGRVELSQDHQTTEVAPVTETKETDEKIDDVEVPGEKEDREEKLPPLDTRAPKTDEPEQPAKEDTEETKPEEKVEDKKEPVVAALDGKDSKIFMKAICPECGEERLTKSASVDNFQGVYCGSCAAEYAVDLSTEEIFKYKG